MRYSLELEKGSDVGRVRQQNEDCVGIDSNQHLFVLADGMGGHNAGEIASAMAVDFLLNGVAQIQHRASEIRGYTPDAIMDQLNILISEANRLIYEAGLRENHLKGMGTTVVVGLVVDEKLFYAHVGDSRLYCLREGQLIQLTEDHTLLQEVKNDSLHGNVDFDATIPANIVTRALGAGPEVVADCGVTELRLGDIYFACSDGVNDRLPDTTIQHTIEASEAMASVIAHTIMLANEAGGEDNISVVMMSVKKGTFVDGLKRLFS